MSDARTSGGGTHEELVSAFAAVDNPGKHLQREHRLRGGGAFRGGEVPRGGRRGGLWGLPLEPRCVECCCRAYAQLHRLPCVRESILLARRPPRVRRRRRRRERRRREMRHRLGREWRIEKKRTNNNNRSRLAISRLSLSHRGDLSPSLHPTSLSLSSSHLCILHTNDARPTHPHHLPSQQQHIQTHLPRRPTPRMDPSTPRYHTARCRVRPCGSWTHERVEQGLVRGMCVELSTFCLTPPYPPAENQIPNARPPPTRLQIHHHLHPH